MNEKQKIAFKHIKDHYNEFHNDQNPFKSRQTKDDQMLFQIYGKAGTGKSYLLESIRKLLGPKVIMLAQSGKAAANVKGMTIQSAFGIDLNTFSYKKLGGEKLQQLRKNFDEIE